MRSDDEVRAVDQVAERLALRFPGVPHETIIRLVHDVHQELDGRPIREFVPLLVEKAAFQRLSEIADADLVARQRNGHVRTADNWK